MPRVALVALGNVLMRDDAVGPYVLECLDAAYEVPGAELLELGTPGAALALHLQDLDAAVIVDAVRVRGAPGEVRVLDKADVLAHAPGLRGGPHDPGLREALFTLQFQGAGPEVVRVVGVNPAEVEQAVGLSPAVLEAVPRAIAAVLRELASCGVVAVPRAEPRRVEPWWERGAG